MNYIPVRKENYADSGDKVSTLGDVEDLDDQQFIVHTAQPMIHSNVLLSTEVPNVPLEEQALHDELMNLMHQESLAKAHNDDQRIAFEEEKRRISIAKGKDISQPFTSNYANTPPKCWKGEAADYNKMDPTIDVTSTPTLRIHKIHPQSQIIGKSTAGVQTRRKLKESTSDQHQALLSFIYKQNRTNHKDQQTCLFACFLSQEEPKKVSQALADESWVEAMQEELLQFKLQDVWVLCDLPEGKRVIGTKWVFRNKRDERELKQSDSFWLLHPSWALLSIRWMSKVHFYMAISQKRDYKQPLGFEDPAHPNKVYRVVKALYGLHQAPRAWYERLSTFLLKHGYRRGAIDKTLFIKRDRRDIMLVQVYVDDIIFGSTKSSMVKDFEELMQKEFKMSSMGELTFFLGLQVKQSNGGIFLSQDKYVKDILNKFDFRTIKPASTPIEAHKSLGKDEEGEDVDVHTYRNKSLWLDSSTKQNMLHTSKCCCSVLWMQNQLLDYGFNFMNTEIHIDNKSTICIVRNPVFHSKTKHIQIRHHFIRDFYEQRLINVVKVHTDDNVADLLTKGFDLARFNFLKESLEALSLHLRGGSHRPRLQQFWTTASLRVINDVPHIRAMVAGKKILISEETIRADLLFDDANGVDCFPKQVIWDTLRDIGYEGHISNGTPFLMYPRFVQLFLNKQLEGVDRPQDFMPSVTLPSKIFTFMRKHSPKFSCRITPLTPSMLEVVTALAAEEEHSTSPHSKAASSARDAQGTPSQSAAPASISQGTADVPGTDNSQGTASLQGTAASLGTARLQVRRLNKSNSFLSNTDYQAQGQAQETVQIRTASGQASCSLEGTLSEEHYVQEEDTADPFFDDIVDKDAAVAPDIDRKSNEIEVLERKSDETEEINIEEKEASNVKSGDTEELIGETQRTAIREYYYSKDSKF
ncbi:putative ribonuclease H-like domain-containing protein [Tanacetum coccineum]|uniref:Ribonuclease H-like domain-containing protein n=1 Tax=Tanacetum coccineum TaxID=301880 RepID=A0ABQ5EH96_9ASTR